MSKPVDLDKKPPPDKSIINKIIKVGGRPLPGMVSSSTALESDQRSGGDELTLQDCKAWWFSEESWKELEHSNAEEENAKTFTQEAENLKRALYVLDHLIRERGTILQDHITVLQEVVDVTDKEVKIAGIIWATVGALGLAAAVRGVRFAPLTKRASLAVAAVAALGVSATIIYKTYTRKKVEEKLETVLKEHSTSIEEIERCVKFIGSKVDCLKKYDLSTLTFVRVNPQV